MRVPAALLMCLVCSAWSAPLVAANLALDVASSRVRFHLHALGWWPIRGEASAVGRVVVADAGTRIDVHVPLDSLRMDREGYREWALSPEFFAAARHPQLHFRADAIPRSRLRDGGEISGWLEVRGQRRQARFILVASDCTAAAPTCRVRASGELSRRAFGMRTRRLTLGDRIRIDLDLHLVPAR